MDISEVKPSGKDQCLVDSATTHTILRSREYFTQLTLIEANVRTISGVAKMIEGSGRACILLPEGTKLIINDALYSSKSRRNLLSFRDMRLNGFHMETMNQGGKEYLCITGYRNGKKNILEKLLAYSSGIYYTHVSPIEVNVTSEKSDDKRMFTLWHDRLGHPGNVMMHRIIESSNGHSLKNVKILRSNDFNCTGCSLGKLRIRPSKSILENESPVFLERIQGDICGPIVPPCGPFRYFMVLIDASTRWSHVSLLSTRNIAFAKLLA